MVRSVGNIKRPDTKVGISNISDCEMYRVTGFPAGRSHYGSTSCGDGHNLAVINRYNGRVGCMPRNSYTGGGVDRRFSRLYHLCFKFNGSTTYRYGEGAFVATFRCNSNLVSSPTDNFNLKLNRNSAANNRKGDFYTLRRLNPSDKAVFHGHAGRIARFPSSINRDYSAIL